ncbi:hypothetical protein WNY61_17045 [Sulfitobacter sp. AS92]|uniref:hypothetical protein n=1 Tax=Sulfitobacter sp. AS92 TaxID=3135783 RepID=UPI00316E2DE1
MQLMQIRPTEQVNVDQDCLGLLYTQLGEVGAEDVVCRAMEELALRMSHCKKLHQAQDRAGLRKSVHRLIAIAEQIGMALVARVAVDVVACIDAEDDIATAATLSRLVRSGERSLTAIWDLPDLTI